MLQFGAVCFDGLGEASCCFDSLGLSVAVFGSALQSVAECYGVLQRLSNKHCNSASGNIISHLLCMRVCCMSTYASIFIYLCVYVYIDVCICECERARDREHARACVYVCGAFVYGDAYVGGGV